MRSWLILAFEVAAVAAVLCWGLAQIPGAAR